MESSQKSKSSDLSGRIGDTLAPLVPNGSSILLGLSGGVDSVVLLHLLTRLAPARVWKLSALHVHHGISPRADEWAAFCSSLCEKYGVPLTVERVDVAPLRDKGIEAAARELRHAALMRQPVDFIALAHHQDDQAETLLLQVLRGAGVKGAAAMPLLKRAAHVPGASLLRPLLDVSRADVLAYAERHELRWVDDESNEDESYPRNFLRHRVLPLLDRHFVASRATLARSASHFAEAAVLMDALAQQDSLGAWDGKTLAVARLAELERTRAKNLLRWFLYQRGALMPDQARLEEMLRQILMARVDAQMRVAWGGWEMRRYRGRVYAEQAQPGPGPEFSVAWRGEERLELPQLGGTLFAVRREGEGASAAKMRAATVRLRRGEERLRPDATRPIRSLQYMFQAAGVPPWQRPRWPLLFCGEQLVAVPGIGIDTSYRAAPSEPGLVLTWAY